jgi:tetratricopeptide (TPR) repeat protein
MSEEDEELVAYIAECREAVAEKPSNAPNRLKLGQALEEAGDLKGALSEYRASVAIAPKYSKGAKNVSRLETQLGAEAAGVKTSSVSQEGAAPEVPKEQPAAKSPEPAAAAKPKSKASPALLGKVAANLELSPDVKIKPTGGKCAAARDLPPDVLAFKAEGNAHVSAKKYTEAVACYTKAIKSLDAAGQPPDAKLHTNRAAAYLSCEPTPKYVGAAMDGQLSMETDPEWWKVRASVYRCCCPRRRFSILCTLILYCTHAAYQGYWYRGQAIYGMIKGKPASTSTASRAEQAMQAFQGCMQCASLPDSKRAEVVQFKEAAQQRLMQSNPACAQQ